MPAIPKMNAPDEQVPFLRYLKQRDEAREKELRELRLLVSASQKSAISGTDLGARVNVAQQETAEHVAIHHEEIEELKGRPGLPKGGWGGWVARRRSDDGEAVWGIDLLGAEPACFIELGGDVDISDEDRAWWTNAVIGYGAGLPEEETEPPFYITQGMMPLPILAPDKCGIDLSTSQGWRDQGGLGNQENTAPARYFIQCTPRYDGQVFTVAMPLNTNRMFYESMWSHIDLMVLNTSSTMNMKVAFLYLGGYYEGTRVAPGDWYQTDGTPDHDARALSLVPGEWLEWRVENPGGGSGAATARIVPANGYSVPTDFVNNSIQQFSGATGDRWWEKNVRAREHVLPFSWMGTLASGGGEHEWVNHSRELRTVGLVAATATTPSSSGDIQIDVRIDGVSILSSPLVIAAGQDRGTATPAPSRWPVGSSGPSTFPGALGQIELAKWNPGSALTAHVVNPGTGAANLTIQVYYG